MDMAAFDSDFMNQEHMETLLSQILEQQDEDFVLEVLGTVSNLRLRDLDWALVLAEFKDLMPFLLKRLSLDFVQDDLVLEVLLMIGTLSSDEGCAAILSRSGVIPALVHLLKEQQTDDEFVCQILFVFYHMAFHKETRDALLQDTQISMFLLNLMHDTNPEICRICDQTLDVIADFDESWFLKVKMERFLRHNAQWLKMIQDQDLLIFSEEPEELELYSPSDDLIATNRCLTLDFQHMELGHVLVSSSAVESRSADPGFSTNEGFFLDSSNCNKPGLNHRSLQHI